MYQYQYELLPDFELEQETFQDIILPPHVVNHVFEILKVKQQIALGSRNSRKLVEFVFFLRHPDLQGKVKATDNKYKKEYEQIFFNVVAPTLNAEEAAAKPSPTVPGPAKKDTTLKELWQLLKWFGQHTGRKRP